MGIDFVILWVDGNDPEWQREKAKYQGVKLDDSNTANRYRDWGLLPYWFRAVEKFTPWVRKIHFVTCGHLPAFLNVKHPKLNIVKHSDYIPGKNLPTFSSHAIEMNIHRITDLSEQFVYFNDDMFILRPMQQTAFFQDGLPCTYGGEYPLEMVGKQEIWQHAMVNNLGVVNAHFNKREQVSKYGKKYRASCYRWQDNIRTLAAEKLFPNAFTGFKNLHAPAAYLKKTFEEVWKAEPELLDLTSSHRFRAADSVNQWVCLWWQVASGSFTPYCVDNAVLTATNETINELSNIIKVQSHDMVCINDPDGDVNVEALSAELKAAFETILPEKSGFEI